MAKNKLITPDEFVQAVKEELAKNGLSPEDLINEYMRIWPMYVKKSKQRIRNERTIICSS